MGHTDRKKCRQHEISNTKESLRAGCMSITFI